jgi:hypothetical protein
MCLPELPNAEGFAKGVPNAIAVFGLNPDSAIIPHGRFFTPR